MAALVVTVCVACESAWATEPSRRFADQILPLLKHYCFECHAEGAAEGEFSFDSLIIESELTKHPESWWKVLKNVRAGVMPPKDSQRLSDEEKAALADWIKFEAFGISRDAQDPGPPVIRRLNRSEYGATVSDLMGIPFDAAVLFPPDDSGFGFDNVGDALSISPLLLEKYVRAVQGVVDRAVPKQTWITPYQEFFGNEFKEEKGGRRGHDLPGKVATKVSRQFEIDDAGKYDLLVSVKLHGSFNYDPAKYRVIFSVDGAERSQNEYGWDENKLHKYTLQEDLAAGNHEIAFELQPIKADAKADEMPTFNFENDATFVRFEVANVRIEGPAETTKRVHPKGYAKFFSRRDASLLGRAKTIRP